MGVDGRKLSHAKLEEIRFEAVKAVQGGEAPTAVARRMGLYTNRIFLWLATYRSGGWQALRARKATGRPKRLGATRIRWVYETVTTKTPLQFKLPLGLWTRAQIRTLIAQHFAVKLSLVSVGRLLVQLGLIYQRPPFRVYQQDRSLLMRWLNEEYPKIRAQAKRAKAEIFFEDECGARSDFHGDTIWAQEGKTSVARETGQRLSLNVISAVSPRGELRFMVVRGEINAGKFIEFLKRLVQGQHRPIYLIVDGHPSHRSKNVKAYVKSLQGRLRLLFLLPRSSELNPNELVLNEVENNGVGHSLVRAPVDLMRANAGRLRYLQKRSAIDRSFFRRRRLAMPRAPTSTHVVAHSCTDWYAKAGWNNSWPRA
jgi:transposase